VKATIRAVATPLSRPGLEVVYAIDVAPFVKHSLRDVVETLAVAIGLVFLVMLLFPAERAGNTDSDHCDNPWCCSARRPCSPRSASRYFSTVSPCSAWCSPIGLLVDDAIVVVENVERVMEEEHLPPKEATRALDGADHPAPSSASRWCSRRCFVPMAFFSAVRGVSSTGSFSITIVSSMIFVRARRTHLHASALRDAAQAA